MKILSTIGAVLLAFAVTVRAQSPYQDIGKVVEDTLAGPWAVGGGFEHSTSGTGVSGGFVTVTYNLLPNTNGPGFSSGPIVGYEDMFGKGRSQQGTLSGGWSVSGSGHWFSFVGKTFLTNIVGTATGYQLITTPKGGNAVGAVTGGSVSLDVYQFDNFHLKPTFIYNNRNGQPGYNGNFIGGMLFVSHDF